MTRSIKRQLKTIFYWLKEKKQKTYIAINSKIEGKVFFEGNNYVGARTYLSDCQIGKMTYLSSDCNFSCTKIGKYCSIGPACRVVYGNHPTSVFVSSHPAFYRSKRPAGICYVTSNKFKEIKYADRTNGNVVWIGNDVWMASGVMIIGGVTIGNGAIIAAGSVVTRDVPPYAFVGGNPARVIRYRFTKEQIVFLEKLKWWDKEVQWIKKYAEYFEDIDFFMRVINQEK